MNPLMLSNKLFASAVGRHTYFCAPHRTKTRHTSARLPRWTVSHHPVVADPTPRRMDLRLRASEREKHDRDEYNFVGVLELMGQRGVTTA